MRRITAVLCALIFCLTLSLPLSAYTESTPEATISPNAEAYDPEHPEDLSEDQLAAASAILIEEKSGTVIFEKNADQVMYPASTTKIMTVLLGILAGEMDETAIASATALNVGEGSSRLGLREGEEINFRDLLYATMLSSGNEAANVIAETVSGSIENFVNLMNQAAVIYGMTSTHFANPHGYHDDNHYTTARDLATLAREAMKNETFRDIAGTTSYNLPRSNTSSARTVESGHLIQQRDSSYYYEYATGIKTGTTSQAGYCFVGSATKNGVSLISVVLYSNRYDRWRDTKKLFEYGFSQYVSATPIDLYQKNPVWVQTSNYSLEDADMGRLNLTCVAVDPTASATIIATQEEIDLMAEHLWDTVLINYTRDFSAPIASGEVVGTMTYFPDDADPVVYNLIASRSVAARSNVPKTLEEIAAETQADPNPFPPLSLELVLLFLSPLIVYGLILLMLHWIFKVLRKRHARLPKNSRRYLK